MALSHIIRIGLLVMLCPTLALAQAPASTIAETPGQVARHVTAPVAIDGDTLFEVRGISSYPAAERAATIEARIRDVAANPALDPQTMRVVDEANFSSIMIGDTLLLSVVDADAEIEGLKNRMVVAESYMKIIQRAIVQYRESRTTEHLSRNAAIASAATVGMIIVGWLFLWSFRQMQALLTSRYRRKMQGIEIQSFKVVRSEQIKAIVDAFLSTVRALIILLATALYVDFVLSLFPWTAHLSSILFDLIANPLKSLATGFIQELPNLIFLVVLLVVIRWMLRMTHLFFDSVAKEMVTFENFEPEWALPTYRIVRVAVIVFALVLAYPHIPGSSSNAFKGLSIFMAVLASVGSPAIVANIFAGYSLTYRRAFRLGDRIKVGDVIGEVVESRLMVTHLRTPKNEEVILPNSVLLNSNVINYSSLAADNGLILHTSVGIGYEVPWRQVEAMLLEAAKRTPNILSTPAPFVLQSALGDFAVNYELNVYSDRPLQMANTYSVLHSNIQDVFNEYGVQIMTPSYENDPAEPKLVPKDRWYAAPAKPADDA